MQFGSPNSVLILEVEKRRQCIHQTWLKREDRSSKVHQDGIRYSANRNLSLELRVVIVTGNAASNFCSR